MLGQTRKRHYHEDNQTKTTVMDRGCKILCKSKKMAMIRKKLEYFTATQTKQIAMKKKSNAAMMAESRGRE